MLVVDTNILVYAADADSPFHDPCRHWLEDQRARPDAWFATWPVIYEFLRVITHPRVAKRPWNANAAWGFIAALLASPGFDILVPTERHAAVAREVISERPELTGNVFHDCHTVVLMREHGISRICTRDSDFARFPSIAMIDPLRV